jgi:cytochrome c oxidase subunit 2
LELIWTVIPAAVLAVLIIYGLRTWSGITSPASSDAVLVELYARQFDWTARYPGADGGLGATDFRLINGTNPLGIVTRESIATRIAELDAEIVEGDSILAHAILSDTRTDELSGSVERMRRNKTRIINLRSLMEQDIAEKGEASAYLHGADDIVIKEFRLPVRKEAEILIRSQDVIHSAYLPHMRIQMNAVPGMTTRMKMVPTITTDSMRTNVMKDDTFDFILLCNKICGASHYNMQMPLTITTNEEYSMWLKEAMKKPFQPVAEATTEEAAPAVPVTDTTTVAAVTDAQAE